LSIPLHVQYTTSCSVYHFMCSIPLRVQYTTSCSVYHFVFSIPLHVIFPLAALISAYNKVLWPVAMQRLYAHVLEILLLLPAKAHGAVLPFPYIFLNGRRAPLLLFTHKMWGLFYFILFIYLFFFFFPSGDHNDHGN
jgi:hypothetical protein